LALFPALADAPSRTTPRPGDIVGVGSQTIQALFDQLSLDFNVTRKAPQAHLYSWDGTGPSPIVAKKGCRAAHRPSNSLQGILGTSANPLGLTYDLRDSQAPAFCTDFARSDQGPEPGFPPDLVFAPFGLDGVSYATNRASNAPADLTAKELAEIYSCAISNWNQVGGKSGLINAQLPQSGSSTRQFFLIAIGLAVAGPGPCVNNLKGENPGNVPEGNEGLSKFLQGRNTIFPYSIPDWIAQVFHSAKCLTESCTPVGGVVCKPRKGKNLFSCDVHGTMVLRDINRTSPTLIINKSTRLNPKFTPAFVRYVSVVVREAPKEPDLIPAYLQKLFGPKGWLFDSKTAAHDICAYGFAPIPPRPC
jgi:hypothetical protein